MTQASNARLFSRRVSCVFRGLYMAYIYMCPASRGRFGRRLRPSSLRGDIDFLKGQYLSDTRIPLDLANDQSCRVG